MATHGFKSFRGRSFDPDNLMLMLEDETYTVRRPGHRVLKRGATGIKAASPSP
jgi:hypothetical protein